MPRSSIVHGLLNTFGVRVVAFLSDVSVWWHVIGVLVIAVVLVLRADPPRLGQLRLHQVREPDGTLGSLYVFCIGLLMAQYTFTGYDASAHMSEETRNADIAAPRGIVSSIVGLTRSRGWC